MNERVVDMLLLLLNYLFFLFNFSITKTEAIDNLQYLNHSCSSNKTFTPNSTYQSNLQTLLTSLSSHATTAQFFNTHTDKHTQRHRHAHRQTHTHTQAHKHSHRVTHTHKQRYTHRQLLMSLYVMNVICYTNNC